MLLLINVVVLSPCRPPFPALNLIQSIMMLVMLTMAIFILGMVMMVMMVVMLIMVMMVMMAGMEGLVSKLMMGIYLVGRIIVWTFIHEWIEETPSRRALPIVNC